MILAIIVVSFFALIMAGSGMIKEINELQSEYKLSRKHDKSVQEICGQISGMGPGEIKNILGNHIHEISLADLNQGLSTKYYEQDELIHSRDYLVKGKTVTVFFNKGLVTGWSL